MTFSQEQESGEASGFDEGELEEDLERPPHLQRGRQQHSIRKQVEQRGGASDERGGGGEGGGMPGEDAGGEPKLGGNEDSPSALRVVSAEQREREELSSLMRELTRYVSVQDAMRSLDTVCQDLKKGIKKLDKLLRLSKVS